jgi:hypothetical protein
VRAERSLPCLLGSLRSGLTLLHDFIDRQRLAEQTLALRSLDGRTSNLWIKHHDDCKALGLARLGIGNQDRVLDRHERREEFADLLDLDSRIEVTHVNLEHRHGRYSRWLRVGDQA